MSESDEYDYQEQMPQPELLLSRVLASENRLEALKDLVRALRDADRELTEDRATSLALQLHTTAAHILTLTNEQRESDRREYTSLIDSLEERRIAATATLDQKVRDWRASDREAQTLYSAEIQRRLKELNNEHGRTAHVLNNSVPREVFQAEKEALQNAITALDRTLLGMTPIAVSDKTHAEMRDTFDRAILAAATVLDTKIEVAQKAIADLKEYVDKTSGRSAGMAQLYGWAIGAVGLIISVIILANTLSQ